MRAMKDVLIAHCLELRRFPVTPVFRIPKEGGKRVLHRVELLCVPAPLSLRLLRE